MTSQLLKAAGFIVYRRVSNTLQYLLLQTSYGEHHWTPPKGHVDPGESDWETALRETEEESGLTLNDLSVVKDFKVVLNYDVVGHKDGITRPKSVIYWLAQIKPGAKVVLCEEHQDFKWLPIKEACDYAKFDNLQEALKKCHDFLSKNQMS